MPNITLKKIAEILGISVATASKALKDYADISDETKQKVKSLAEELDYKPNSFAQSLRNRESKIIGLIAPQIVHHFFANIIKGVIDAAEEQGYLVITLQSGESYETEKKQLQLLLDKNVDGILISLSDKTINYDHVADIIKKGVPVVLYDKISKLLDCSKVIIDDRKAAYDATKFLIDTGCKRVAHIRGPLKPQTTIDRFLGYKSALKDNNIEYNESLVFETKDLTYDDGYGIAEGIFKSDEDIDGIFAFTDLLATGAMVRLTELGMKVPDDISIIGFSNWFLTKITSPPLSTVDQPGYEMGVKAFKLLYREIQEKKKDVNSPKEIIKIPTKVIPRNSTRPML
ncbi:MAG: LacI family transcriptional regulator [Bacteroidia bacterium]|nr:LacI family transcriptional regulator [Bacteroidia bacterium]MBT8270149.1 LacI family transcriptional regulator [Bacteroidia bacterium]NNF82928.1 LacI family DNA-binding transcriptional regulator [Flavobacteriaceae bacterium]NNK68877.1 LacI family DNA-binding transcriptional regulator [Flavobacteriaceae bacterium]NNL80859.1 LacI family DNA-binding transcriptional regulator [Flavobacteriaceae bacterium]